MPIARLSPADGGLALESPYDAALVAAIKALPYNDRRWDQARKRWIIAHEKAPEICRLVEQHLGVTLQIPAAGPGAASELRVLRVEYVGRAKARDDGTSNASGYLGQNDRSLVFPESVLRAWFLDDLDDGTPATNGADKRPRTPTGPLTLYTILAIKQTATADELKKAYRRLVMQLHPDHNKEPDASEQFQRLQHAYDVLKDAKTRRKYDAGLKLEASLTKHEPEPFRPYGRPKNMAVNRHDDEALGYRSPLRCGMLVCEGTPRVGQFIVSKILKWDDIIDGQGRTMVSSWPVYGDSYEVTWWI